MVVALVLCFPPLVPVEIVRLETAIRYKFCISDIQFMIRIQSE
jgi:hypothetical protein